MTRDVEIGLPAEIASEVLSRAPISVMNENLAVVGQTAAGQTIALDPGLYAARAVLPDGREFETAFAVPNEGPLEPVVLTDLQQLDEAIAALAAQAEGVVMRTMKIVPAVFGQVFGLTSSAVQAIATKLVARRSTLLLVTIDPATGEGLGFRTLTADSEKKVDVAPSIDRRLVRLECNGHADLNIALPTSHSEGVRIRFDPGTDLPLDVRLQDEEAELMRRYLFGGQAQQLSQALETQRDRASEMLAGKFERPIAAALGGYVMLSVGPPTQRTGNDLTEADWFDQWTLNLLQGFPWLPDALYLRAECLARRGDHAQALGTLTKIPRRGFPFFSLGLRFALDRLSAYRAAAQEAPQSWAGEHAAVITALLDHLSPVATYADFSQTLLTFTTNADGRPGNQVRTSSDPVEAPPLAVIEA